MSDEPAPPRFDERYAYEFTVPASAIDQYGHANNEWYLRWVLEAAERHSSSRGWDADRYAREGAAWIVRRHEIDYLRSAHEGSTLRATTWIERYTRVTALRRTELRDVAHDALVCACATTWVFVALPSLRPTRISDAFFRDFGGTLRAGDRAGE